MSLLIAIALAAQPKCLTQADVKNAVCWALCRRDGADSGTYVPKKGTCSCGFEKEYREFTESVVIVPRYIGGER